MKPFFFSSLILLLVATQPALAVNRVSSVSLPNPIPKGFKGPIERKGAVVPARKKITSDIGKVTITNTKFDVTLVAPYEAEFTVDESLILHYGKALIKSKGLGANQSKPIASMPIVKVDVIGSEFMLSYSNALSEAEVIVFERNIQLIKNGKKQAINQGFWIGEGGRFGLQLVKPILLPDESLDYFKSMFRM
ncbi:MAG: hypothetical protein KA715_13460 [Xanthomonadaceae bacterium]|nr:hypothetical protein [Xanthomonadaceae bacterium]